jgi:D-xylose transport system permease protein
MRELLLGPRSWLARGAVSDALSGRARRMRSISLIVILAGVSIAFQFLTEGLFLSPRNLSVLAVQASMTALLASGMVMVIVAGHIDLSVGASVALCAIAAAILIQDYGLSVPAACAGTMVVGIVIGVWHGTWVALSRVPAFIVTLASLLGLRGLALIVTNGYTISPTGDITVLASGSIPAPVAGLLLGALVLGYVYVLVTERNARVAAGMESSLTSHVLIPGMAAATLATVTTLAAAAYRGIPFPVALLIAFASAIWFLMRHTVFGRRVYALGGNAEAAKLSGINWGAMTFSVFVIMGVLYAVAGLVMLARLDSAPPAAAQGLELNVIAATVVGGTSLFGGVGTVPGAIVGALLMESLNNGMSLMNFPSATAQVVVGLVLLVAVFLDIRGRANV